MPIFEKWYDQNAKLSKKGHGSGDPSKTGNSVFFHGGNLDNMSNDEIEKIMESHRFDVAYSVSGNVSRFAFLPPHLLATAEDTSKQEHKRIK